MNHIDLVVIGWHTFFFSILFHIPFSFHIICHHFCQNSICHFCKYKNSRDWPQFVHVGGWGHSFGTGIISFLFQIIGYTPEINIELIRLVRGVYTSSTNIWTSFMGRLPMTLEDFLLRLSIDFCTFSGDMRFSKYISSL